LLNLYETNINTISIKTNTFSFFFTFLLMSFFSPIYLEKIDMQEKNLRKLFREAFEAAYNAQQLVESQAKQLYRLVISEAVNPQVVDDLFSQWESGKTNLTLTKVANMPNGNELNRAMVNKAFEKYKISGDRKYIGLLMGYYTPFQEVIKKGVRKKLDWSPEMNPNVDLDAVIESTMDEVFEQSNFDHLASTFQGGNFGGLIYQNLIYKIMDKLKMQRGGNASDFNKASLDKPIGEESDGDTLIDFIMDDESGDYKLDVKTRRKVREAIEEIMQNLADGGNEKYYLVFKGIVRDNLTPEKMLSMPEFNTTFNSKADITTAFKDFQDNRKRMDMIKQTLLKYLPEFRGKIAKVGQEKLGTKQFEKGGKQGPEIKNLSKKAGFNTRDIYRNPADIYANLEESQVKELFANALIKEMFTRNF